MLFPLAAAAEVAVKDAWVRGTVPATGAFRSETAFTDSISPNVSPASRLRPGSGRSQ